MDWTLLLALIVAGLLCMYLLVALLLPERFS
ncbi:MAG: K(+)-transporting ATPase subunit F [Planctomycetota bacterium]|nr:MAG: K(+)-transporting ATPase subunit F [Planctomycetota bacterium]